MDKCTYVVDNKTGSFAKKNYQHGKTAKNENTKERIKIISGVRALSPPYQDYIGKKDVLQGKSVKISVLLLTEKSHGAIISLELRFDRNRKDRK